jgi:SAM-dependent methyltransferase
MMNIKERVTDFIYKFFILFGNDYWNTRYILGGDSGYNTDEYAIKYTNYVWSIIEKTVGKQKDVIDVGCGDLQFWKGRDCEKYIGIDISLKVIETDKKLRTNWTFIASPADKSFDISAETVICMNTLYHIMNDTEYDKIIDNIIAWSKKWIMIVTWRTKPKGIKEDDFYEKYRDFDIYQKRIINSGFTLVLQENISFDDYGCLWIFERNKKE